MAEKNTCKNGYIQKHIKLIHVQTNSMKIEKQNLFKSDSTKKYGNNLNMNFYEKSEFRRLVVMIFSNKNKKNSKRDC